MQRRIALTGLAIALQTLFFAAAHAQEPDLDCNSFVRNADGSWTVIRKVYIPVQKVRVNEGVVFYPNQTFLGDDMTVRLGKDCPQIAVTPAEAAPAMASQPQVPQVSLSRYADANGNIDVRRLTCGHLNEASSEEASTILSWYSGANGAAPKNRIINLARVRYAVRSVVDYCKANPEKNLSQVMELMLR